MSGMDEGHSGHQAAPPSDERAASTAGAIARRTNDGSVHTTSGNDSRTGSLSGVGLVEAATGAACLVRQLIEHGPERQAVPVARGDHVGEPHGSGSERLRQRGQCIGERAAALGAVHGRRERVAHRLRGVEGEFGDGLLRGEARPDAEDQQVECVGQCPVGFAPSPTCRKDRPGPTDDHDRTHGDGGRHRCEHDDTDDDSGDDTADERGDPSESARRGVRRRRRRSVDGASWADHDASERGADTRCEEHHCSDGRHGPVPMIRRIQIEPTMFRARPVAMQATPSGDVAAALTSPSVTKSSRSMAIGRAVRT